MSEFDDIQLGSFLGSQTADDRQSVSLKFSRENSEIIITFPPDQIVPLIGNLLSELGKSQQNLDKSDRSRPTLPVHYWEIGETAKAGKWGMTLTSVGDGKITYLFDHPDLPRIRETLEAMEGVVANPNLSGRTQ